MMFVIDSMFLKFLSVVVALSVTFIVYCKWKYQYWKKRNMPCLEPSIPFGNIKNPARAKETQGIAFKEMYNEMKRRKWKHGGLYSFTIPTYMPIDLTYVSNIMTKDFQYFVDRGFYYNEKDDPLSAHLIALGGTKWRNLRMKLTPTFTSGKMKMMFQTLLDCEENLQRVMTQFYDNHEAIDIKEVLGCFTTDIIGSVAFGLDFNTFKEENSPFRVYGKRIFAQTSWERLQMAFTINFPSAGRALGLRITPKEVENFFMKVVKDNVDYREKNNFSRNDFMQLMIDLKNKNLTSAEQTLTIDELAAQCYMFFAAGFETSSTTMTFVLYELARHQDIQNKVRKEIEEVLAKHGGRVTYEAIQDMKYMQQVIDETLRIYPPVPFLTRDCVKDYKITDQDIIIEKGTKIIIPVMGIHYDEEYYPDSNKFDPERFSDKNKQSRHPYTHIPFGEGPRICIGMRFGLMLSKVGLTSLLRKYRFTVNKKTQEPLKFQVQSFLLATEGEVWLNAQKIEK